MHTLKKTLLALTLASVAITGAAQARGGDRHHDRDWRGHDRGERSYRGRHWKQERRHHRRDHRRDRYSYRPHRGYRYGYRDRGHDHDAYVPFVLGLGLGVILNDAYY